MDLLPAPDGSGLMALIRSRAVEGHEWKRWALGVPPHAGGEDLPQEYIVATAPARVNLLGEHTDYTGGLVLPLAIPFFTTARIIPNTSQICSFRSETFPTDYAFSCASSPVPTKTWSDYPVGVLQELRRLGITVPPFELSLSGTVPLGAGLSSSASVEIAACLAMLRFADVSLTPVEVALLCQRAENQFVGSPCGIMDQFVIANAVAGHALRISTRELSFEHIPLNRGEMQNACLIIFNSMVKHSIASGEYRTRRKEVEAGQTAIIQQHPAVTDLGMATLQHLEVCSSRMTRESYLRCRHIIRENSRVREASHLLEEGSVEAFGQIMLEAHASQRDDFACSCEETDFLVERAMEIEGSFGARMTGGGFGGCTIHLVHQDRAEDFIRKLLAAYWKKFAVQAEVYRCNAVNGAMCCS